MTAMDTDRETDAGRALRLLWREPGSGPVGRGPRPARSVEGVIRAAIAVADADPAGLDAVTMRRVAQELGVTPMTLYTYIPGKAVLLDLMLDTVYQDMPRPPWPPDTPWRDRVTAVADANRDLFERHPWVARLPTSRPPLGPGVIAKYEHELRALDGLGLDDLDMDAALTHLLAFVQSTARAALDQRATEAGSALTDQQWWDAHAPVLAKIHDPERFPLAGRVGTAAGQAYRSANAPDHGYAFGLARVLDGLAALIDRRTP
ncbi:TetR family transcriptional regulator [Streptomyces xiamenensis]|uniref:TetR family transcriptional regulator n=2 Tax=Streptomyces xiamenensis TaxID=408015 RepID=A0A0F7CPT7_9ACTN|nr:TetR family transcriptional regulator [Streptomyces xiamenensis]